MCIKTKKNIMRSLSMKSCHLPKRQRGMVLVLSLVLLVVMTLIGISSMNGANMELRAVANAQQHHKAFSAGQSLLEYAISGNAVTTAGTAIDYQTQDAIVQTVEETLNSVISTASIVYGGCSVGIGSSLEEGKGINFNFYEISGIGQNNLAATAVSVQSLGVRYPSAGCSN
jgi:type IV pilus assembly protein PilX